MAVLWTAIGAAVLFSADSLAHPMSFVVDDPSHQGTCAVKAFQQHCPQVFRVSYYHTRHALAPVVSIVSVSLRVACVVTCWALFVGVNCPPSSDRMF